MKLLVFGSGMIVDDFLHCVKELQFDQVYICGRNKEKVNQLKDKFNLDRVFYSPDEALESDADLVYIALPNNIHFEYAKNSLNANKHVIVEKPFMANYNQAIKIWEIAQKNNRMIFEASLVFYFPAFKSLSEDISTLGEIHLADCNFSQYSSRYNRFINNDIAPALSIENCGGALMDLNVYNINLITGLFGEPEKVNYFATIKNNIDVSGIVILNYEHLKAICSASKSTSVIKHISLQGELGSLWIPDSVNKVFQYKIEYNSGKSINRTFEDRHHRMYHEFQNFINIIKSNNIDTCGTYISRSLTTMKVLDKCRNCANIVFNSDK